jgi:hypothetical protein
VDSRRLGVVGKIITDCIHSAELSHRFRIRLTQHFESSQKLKSLWDIQGPEFQHDRLSLSLDYTVNEKITKEKMAYTLYDGDGCQEKSNVIDNNNPFLLSTITVSPSADGGNQAEISLSVEPNEITSSPIYTAIDATHAEIVFCVRYSLYTGEPSNPDSIEVNFVETPLKLYVELEIGFEISLVDSARV